MGRKIEILIALISLLIIIVGTTYSILNYYASKDSGEKISTKLEDLNSNVILLIPKDPKIEIEAFGSRPFPGKDLTLYEWSGYLTCFRNNLIPIQENEDYERALFFITNEGKKTKDLRVKIRCDPNSFILAVCINTDNIELEEGDSLDTEAILKIKEVDSIIQNHISLFYQSTNEDNVCTVSYDSEDFDESESQEINLSYYNLREIEN